METSETRVRDRNFHKQRNDQGRNKRNDAARTIRQDHIDFKSACSST